MNVLVIGASGFLGGHVFRTMKKQNHHTIIGTYGRNRENLSSTLRQTNLSSKDTVRDLMNTTKPDVVLWCAKSSTTEDEAPLHANGLAVVLEQMARQTKLVFVSTDGVIPGEQGPYDEFTSPVWTPGNDRIASYTNAKMEAEKMVRKSARNYCIVRTGPIFGKSVSGDWDLRTFDLLSALENGDATLRPQNLLRTFCDVGDLAKAICELAWTDVEGILHVGSPVPDSYYSYAVSCANTFGYPDDRVQSFSIPLEDAAQRHVRLDTTMNTGRALASLQTRFRTVAEALSEYAFEERKLGSTISETGTY